MIEEILSVLQARNDERAGIGPFVPFTSGRR
jgi:hypothetical protein